ncbi:uncharacterized protein PgNI_04864, partial [Pyricularia grisea]|uniref:Uncharacterized protein n=1 Tax=Pyricularia grisea TaxID=148305 RepID=A0A6P8BDY3_PYRGI
MCLTVQLGWYPVAARIFTKRDHMQDSGSGRRSAVVRTPAGRIHRIAWWRHRKFPDRFSAQGQAYNRASLSHMRFISRSLRVKVFCRLRREGFDTDLSSSRPTDMSNNHEAISWLCVLLSANIVLLGDA